MSSSSQLWAFLVENHQVWATITMAWAWPGRAKRRLGADMLEPVSQREPSSPADYSAPPSCTYPFKSREVIFDLCAISGNFHFLNESTVISSFKHFLI